LASKPLLLTLYYFKNHSSSNLNPLFISSYLVSEEAISCYSRVYSPEELESLISLFCTSPIRLVPKPNSSKFCMIQDLSYLRDHPSISPINADINPDKYPTAWGIFEATAQLVLSLLLGSQAATFNISATYRIMPVHPNQQNSLCILWEGKVQVDQAVMFGLALSAGVFRCVADMLVDIYIASGFGPLVKWVDNFFMIYLLEYSWTKHNFLELTVSIGVPWSIEKLQSLSTIQQYIRFDWHLDSKEVSIPLDKLGHIHTLLSIWLQPGFKMTAHDTSSLHGKLIHILSIYPSLRPFLCLLALFSGKF